jgi:hypothetical protein
MDWIEIETQGEALTQMIYHLHTLGPGAATSLLELSRHKTRIASKVAR